MSKMSSHYPFECLWHKLWSKEESGVKTSIWPLTIKSKKSPWITWVQEACHIFLENFRQKPQICFRHHLNQSFSQEVMGVQNGESPNEGIMRLPTWESRKKHHLVVGPMASHKNYYKKEGGGFPQVWDMVILVNLCMLVVHSCTKKCSNYAVTNLLFGLCKLIWIIDMLVTRSSTYPKTPTHLFYPINVAS